MIRIHICDDNAPFARSLAQRIKDCLLSRDLRCELILSHGADEFMEAMHQAPPDLIFMDLKLQDRLEGYDLAEYVRRLRVNCELVFVTNYPEHMSEAFPFRPIGFISKPPSETELEEILDRYLSYYRSTDADYLVSNRNRQLRIPLSDILYFESAAHHVNIFRCSTEEVVRQLRKLDDISVEMAAQGFVRIHKSFLVRLEMIESIDRTKMQVQLRGGKSLPISRSCYSGLMERFIHYRLR